MKKPSPIPNLRWWIGGLLFASTVINYLDRQSLSVLAPYLKADYRWSNEQFALVIIAFRVAYAVGQPLMGRFLDHVGTRKGLSLTVFWYSIAALLTPLATGLSSLCCFRFLLGAGESANWPGAAKAVSEWFPRRERGWAVALFDSGSAVGGAVAPLAMISLYHWFGNWRPAFAVPGLLGIVWILFWRTLYRRPEDHPRLSPGERRLVLADREPGCLESPRPKWRVLLRLPQTWGLVLGRSLTDPVWFFITDWFAIYLVAKRIRLDEGVLAFWIPFAAADLGNFLGGGISSWLVRRGWTAIRARRAVILVSGLGMTLLIPSIFASNLFVLAGLFSVATCCYAAWSTMALTLPADLFAAESVASVSGISGFGSGIGTIASTFLIGWTTDHYSFEPVLVGASLVPLLATALVLLMVRERATLARCTRQASTN